MRLARRRISRAELRDLVDTHGISSATVSMGAASFDLEFVASVFGDLEAAGVQDVTLVDRYRPEFTPEDVDERWAFAVRWSPLDRRVSANSIDDVFVFPDGMLGA